MRLVSYRTTTEELRAGLVVDYDVIDLERAGRQLGVDLPADLSSILARRRSVHLRRRPRGTNLVEEPCRQAATSAALPLRIPRRGQLSIHRPSPRAGGALCRQAVSLPLLHQAGIGRDRYGRGDPYPSVLAAIDYEIEIAAVIGKCGRQIAVEDALDHVFGYVLFNDISARHLSVVGRRKHRPGDEFFDWLVGKWCDTFAVVGPYLVTVDDVPDVGSLEMALRVNGELQQHSSAGEMIFTVPEAIAWISEFLTCLSPGKILIRLGTRRRRGDDPDLLTIRGDVVEATIEGWDNDQPGRVAAPASRAMTGSPTAGGGAPRRGYSGDPHH